MPTFSGTQLGNKTRAGCTDFNCWGIFDILNKHPVGWDSPVTALLLCLLSSGKSCFCDVCTECYHKNSSFFVGKR